MATADPGAPPPSALEIATAMGLGPEVLSETQARVAEALGGDTSSLSAMHVLQLYCRYMGWPEQFGVADAMLVRAAVLCPGLCVDVALGSGWIGSGAGTPTWVLWLVLGPQSSRQSVTASGSCPSIAECSLIIALSSLNIALSSLNIASSFVHL